MSMLQAALAREGVARDHTTAIAGDRRAERARVIAAIHKAFKPEQAALEKLVVRGKLLAAAPVAEIQKQGLKLDYERRETEFGSPYCTREGLELYLGAGRHPERILLEVSERTDAAPLSVELRIHRDVFQSEDVAKFHGHADVNEMLERFFEVVARHVVTVRSA